MRLLSFLLSLTLVAAVAAYFTKPSEKDVERYLKNTLLLKLATQEVPANGDPLNSVALVGCKLRPNDCYQLVRSGIDLTYDDRTLYAQITLTGFGRHASCYGAFTKFTCPGGLQQD